MTYRMADACNTPDLVGDLEADLRGLGATGMGLYVVNLSIPSCERGAGYAMSLAAAGVGVLPIITPGDSPPQNLDLLGPLRTWGAPPCPIAFDLERFSEPSLAWLTGKVTELRQAGYFVGQYGDAAHQAQYASEPWQWRWLADYTFVEGLADGYQAQQWTDRAPGVSGFNYDLSLVEDALVLWGDGAFAGSKVTVDLGPAEITFPAVLVVPGPPLA